MMNDHKARERAEAIAVALRCCGSSPKVDRCKAECIFYRGSYVGKCIPAMTAAAAALIEQLTAEPPNEPLTLEELREMDGGAPQELLHKPRGNEKQMGKGGVSMDRFAYFEGGKWRLRVGDTEYSGLWVDRLAAYEDTGLEPEEIRSLRMDMTIIKAMFGDADVKHMKELCEADKEGRVVVLPCKVGENVYYIFPNCGGYLGYFVSEPYKVTEVGTKGFWTSDILDEQPDAMSVFTPWSDFGKTVFLTRAGAEAAIGGGGDGV